MCSTTSFMQKMENDHGDLADIVRASGGGVGGVGTVLGGGGSCSSNTSNNNRVPTDWQYPSEPVKFPLGIEEPMDNFGDPFSMLRDPLLQELDLTGSGFFVDRSSNSIGGSRVGGGLAAEMNIKDDHTSTTNISSSSNNIFSRILQISPNSKMLPLSPREMIPSGSGSGSGASSSPRGSTTTPSSSSSSLLGNDQYMVKASSSTGNCSIDNAGAGVQISLPRNPGIKRRKSQAKKVVCIPAPAAANSRPSGEVVPSDLWAWRKYGQKPIKGSPYPRGYYRCSSSKGCSARKQVERSRTDPNMLVITYTSEHNHPWPTQRNALAGSTRSQPFKTNATSKSSSSQKLTSMKEQKDISNVNTDNASSVVGVQAQIAGTCSIKEEMGETEKPIDMSTDGEFSHGFHPNTFQSLLSEDTNNPDDFFADLGELDSSDPLNLLLTQGFAAAKADDGKRENKGLDPFSLFDWTGNNNTTNTNNNSSFEDLSSRRGL